MDRSFFNWAVSILFNGYCAVDSRFVCCHCFFGVVGGVGFGVSVCFLFSKSFVSVRFVLCCPLGDFVAEISEISATDVGVSFFPLQLEVNLFDFPPFVLFCPSWYIDFSSQVFVLVRSHRASLCQFDASRDQFRSIGRFVPPADNSHSFLVSTPW